MTRRLLHAGYAQVLRHVVDGGVTWIKLHEQMGLCRTSSQKTLAYLRDQQLAHVGEWQARKVGMRIERTPVFVFGSGEDAPWPGAGKPRPRKPQRTPVELLTFCCAIKALMREPFMGNGLADETGMCHRTALSLIRRLHALRLAYIEDYDRREVGAGYPLWRFGVDRKDKPKPRPMSKREIWNKHNAIRDKLRAQARLLGILPSRRAPANQDQSEAA